MSFVSYVTVNLKMHLNFSLGFKSEYTLEQHRASRIRMLACVSNQSFP